MWVLLPPCCFPLVFLFSHFAWLKGSCSVQVDHPELQLAESPWQLAERETDPLSVTPDIHVSFSPAYAEDANAASSEREKARVAGLHDEQLDNSPGGVGVKRETKHRPGRAQQLALLPAAGVLMLLVGALVARQTEGRPAICSRAMDSLLVNLEAQGLIETYIQRPHCGPHVSSESPPLASLLTGPPFAAESLSTPERLARARFVLHGLRLSEEETWRLHKFKRGQLISDDHAAFYLSSLQGRLDARDEQSFAQTYIFFSWLQAAGELADFKADGRLDNKQLRQCAAARSILFPLKLPLRLPTENESARSPSIVEEHYALGVIDRESRLVRIVDSCKRGKEHYALPLQHLKDLANELEFQMRDKGLLSEEEVSEYQSASRVPEPGFPSIDDPWTPCEWARGVTAASALWMLENAASIAEGRAPRKELGPRLALAETLWMELILGESRSQWH
ncbi:hypothetical protein Esti_000524 [Eimeria stiedai]